MSKKLEITSKHLVNIKPVTDNQKVVFESWKTGQSQFLYGAAGTGKTFVSLYLALQEVLDTTTKWDKVIIVRSLIPTREIGFLYAMRMINLHSIKFLILTWFSLCLNNQMNKHFKCCMIS